MENYKEKYEQALETARKINSGEGVAAPKDWSIPEVIFPELRKSENERIKTNIIKLLRFVRDTYHQYFDECDEAINWLKKVQNISIEQPSEELEKAAIEFGAKQGLELKPFAIKFFKSGAQWQKEQIINKTCEWLRKHVLEYFDDAGVEISTFIENFMTALEDK